MAAKSIYRFSYFSDSRSPFNLSDLRDGDAFAELSPVFLREQNFHYGGLLLNFPVDSAEAQEQPADLTTLGEDDVLVLMTRPPLTDASFDIKKSVSASGSWLEDRIFTVLRQVFNVLTRSEVSLTEPIATLLPPGYENRSQISFLQYKERQRSGDTDTDHVTPTTARITSLRQTFPIHGQQDVSRAGPTRTCCFLIHSPALWVGGPSLFAAWGMTGAITLAFSYLLRTDQSLRKLVKLDRPRFAMVELSDVNIDRRPSDLSFVGDWSHNVLIDCSLQPLLDQDRG